MVGRKGRYVDAVELRSGQLDHKELSYVVDAIEERGREEKVQAWDDACCTRLVCELRDSRVFEQGW